MARTVTVIPSTINPLTRLPQNSTQKRKVAGYARVSTDSEEQLTSYAAQIDYYTNYIKQRPEWEFVDVYTDEGITGVNTKKRDGFKQMIQDALTGKIDLIVTKSISRFARNTVDTLTTVRRLKAEGIEIYFEKENIWTLDSKGELLITIMSSMAQEESRSISENVTWGKRKSAADGKVYLAFKNFLGYDQGPNGTLILNEQEAPIIRRIYREFMQGKTPYMIATELTESGIPTPARKKNWGHSTVLSILTNEKYKGSALLQKMYTVDFLTKKKRKNNGEVPQYYIETSHEAIIPPDEWEQVQREIARRRNQGKKYSSSSILASKLVCGDCGGFFGPKVWNSNSPEYRRVIWQCNDKFKGEHKCTTPHFTEEAIKEKFILAFNSVYDMRDEIIANCELAAAFLGDCTDIDVERDALMQELEEVTELSRKYIHNNASQAQDQEAYLKKYNALVARYDKASARVAELDAERLVKLRKADAFNDYVYVLKNAEKKLDLFDDTIWTVALEKAIVNSDKTITFVFRDGAEVRV